MSKEPQFISDLAKLAREGEQISSEDALASFKFCSEIGYAIQRGDSIKDIVEAVEPRFTIEELSLAIQYMTAATNHDHFKNHPEIKTCYKLAADYLKDKLDKKTDYKQKR
jgi:hypothetical protein